MLALQPALRAGFQTALTLASPLSFFQECLTATAKLKNFTDELIPELQNVSIHLRLGASRGRRLESGDVCPRPSSSFAKADLGTFSSVVIS